MKLNIWSQIKTASSLLSRAVLGLMLLCGSAHAASTFHIFLDTSSLIGHSSGPFSLDFQFNNGSVLGNNTATVNNFSYFGGGALGSSTLIGGALGNLSSGILFNNSSAFQELYQSFTPGSALGFDVFLSSNVDGVTPDSFVFTILDSSLLNITTSGLGDSLVQVNLDSASPTVQTAAGTGAFSGVRASVPEPATFGLLLAGVPLLILAARKRKQTV